MHKDVFDSLCDLCGRLQISFHPPHLTNSLTKNLLSTCSVPKTRSIWGESCKFWWICQESPLSQNVILAKNRRVKPIAVYELSASGKGNPNVSALTKNPTSGDSRTQSEHDRASRRASVQQAVPGFSLRPGRGLAFYCEMGFPQLQDDRRGLTWAAQHVSKISRLSLRRTHCGGERVQTGRESS